MTTGFNDITAPEHVEVRIRGDGKVLWVNVDGVCALRVCNMSELVLHDGRWKETDEA